MHKILHAKNRLILGALLMFSLLIISAATFKLASPPKKSGLTGQIATVYRSATCGCCGQYIAYLKRNGITVEEKIMGNNDSDLDGVKQQFNIPASLQSCHTTRIGNYTIEGHVPIEAIEKLLVEKPSVDGIALPGMPVGSPGMSGIKQEPFEIDSFTANGSTTLFTKV